MTELEPEPSKRLIHPVLARLKGFVNGMNPRWGMATVIVSKTTGDIIRVEDRKSRRSSEGRGGK